MGKIDDLNVVESLAVLWRSSGDPLGTLLGLQGRSGRVLTSKTIIFGRFSIDFGTEIGVETGAPKSFAQVAFRWCFR